jgi:uncharacterized alpha-E superfamily protein
MLARLAENLFWTGRYLERAEDTALLLDVTYHGLLESAPGEAGVAWWSLLEVLHSQEAFLERHEVAEEGTVTEFLVTDRRHGGSILSCIELVRENARSVRELISSELWQAINTFYLELEARDLTADVAREPGEVYAWVKLRCQTIYGVASETMPRDDGWRFMMLGRMLERAVMTCRLLNVRYAQLMSARDAGFHDWAGVLSSAGAQEAYRKQYRTQMDPAHVVEFLLLGEHFPRSVLFCLRAAEHGLRDLAGGGQAAKPQRLLGRIRAELEFRDIEELLEEGLHGFLNRVQEHVWMVANAVADQFFRHELRSDVQLHALRTG